MPRSDASCLVTTDWLAERLEAPDIRVVDASWHMPATGRNGKAEFAAGHIPGAVFFDIDEILDEKSSLPHMIPPHEKFALRARRMGLGDGHRIVVYDSLGLFSAARVWWMFRLFGHPDVAVLDGGLPKWIREGRMLDDRAPNPRERHYTGRTDLTLLRDVTQVARASKLRDEQILDARSPGRFSGAEPEPRPGLRAGHIPGAINIHYATLINPDGTLKSPEALRAVFAAAKVDLDRPIVTSCGSGVTAAIINLALARLGRKGAALYDGSWAEWGAFDDLPIEAGA